MKQENKKTILVVDDTKPIRIMLLKRMEPEYRCLLASNPVEALKLIKEYGSEIDIIISDYEMPKMNGYEFLKKLRSLKVNFPIIMVSGTLNKIRIEELIQLGVKKFMAKPVNITRLINEIRIIMEDSP
ncbi:response regulator [candidate division KSB1 bacterium]